MTVMHIAVVCTSLSGNNRLLGRHLSARLGATFLEVRDNRWFKKLRLMSDLSHDRRPTIAPIERDADSFDHVLFVAPLFDSTIAPAMKTAMSTWGRSARAYSFVTFCGYRRQEQRDKIHAQLVELTGREPAHIAELCVGELVPEKDRRKILIVSNYRVKEPQLARFETDIEAITAWFADET